MFNLGIIGLGGWGRRLVESVQGVSDKVRFVAAATRTPSRADAFARERDISLGVAHSDVLDNPAVDGVVVVGPAGLHAEHAIETVEAGKPVLVIKPLANDRASAEALFEKAAAHGVLVAMGYDRCFSPAFEALREKARAGALGRIVHAEGDFCVDRLLAYEAGDPKTDPKTNPPGSLADHMLYMMIELIGPVAELSACGMSQVKKDFTDCATVGLQFESGATGLLTALGVTANFHRLHVFGTDGWAELRGNNRIAFQPRGGEIETVDLRAVDMCRLELEAFAAAASGERDWPVPPADAIAAVTALEAMGASAASGKAVVLPR